MEYKNIILISSIVILSVIYQVNSLLCYKCNSAEVKGCGTTWEVKKEDENKYIEKCEGENAACRKLETTDTPKQHPVVIRSCWNSSNSELSDDFFTCTELGKVGESCYCKVEPNSEGEDGPPCNGRQPLFANWKILSALVILVFLTMAHKRVL